MKYSDSLFNRLFGDSRVYSMADDPMTIPTKDLRALTANIISPKQWDRKTYGLLGQLGQIPTPYIRDALKASQMSQWSRNADIASDGTATYVPREDAFINALVQTARDAYEAERNNYRTTYRDEVGVRPTQTKSGEYLYRLRHPDTLVAPFARTYNEELDLNID